MNFERGLDPKVAMNTGNFREINSWLEKMGLPPISVKEKPSNEGVYIYNFDGDVDLVGKLLDSKTIPEQLKFNIVKGNFWCDDNELTSLKGCPKEIGGSFSCTNNKLTSHDGKPEVIKGNFWF